VKITLHRHHHSLIPSKQRSRIHPLIGQYLGYVWSESFLRWIQHTWVFKSNQLWLVTRMNNNRMLKIILNCRPNGRIGLGRTFKILSDEAQTGLSRADSWRMMKMLMMIMTLVFCFRKRKVVKTFTNYAESKTIRSEEENLRARSFKFESRN